MKGLGLILGLGLAGVPSLAAEAPSTARNPAAFLDAGIRHYNDGDLEAAVFALDTAVRRLGEDASRRAALVKGRFYLGATHVAMGREDLARAEFRALLAVDPAARPPADTFPQKVVRVFDAVALEKTAATKKKSGRTILILGGVGAAGAVGVALAVGGSAPENRPPTATVSVSPAGQAISGITTMTLTASATDPDGDPLTYSWLLGDGGTASGSTVSHRYDAEGTFPVSVTVSDARGAVATANATVTARSLSGNWRETTFISGAQVWTQNGTNITIRHADPAQDRFTTWGAASVTPPRRVSVQVSFTFAAQVDGRYVGEANEQLDRLTLVQEGGSRTFVFTRQ